MQKADLVHPGEIKEQKNINIMEDKSHLRKYLQHEAMPLVKKGEMLAGAEKKGITCDKTQHIHK